MDTQVLCSRCLVRVMILQAFGQDLQLYSKLFSNCLFLHLYCTCQRSLGVLMITVVWFLRGFLQDASLCRLRLTRLWKMRLMITVVICCDGALVAIVW